MNLHCRVHNRAGEVIRLFHGGHRDPRGVSPTRRAVALAKAEGERPRHPAVHSIFSTRVGKTPASPDRGSKSRSNVGTSGRFASVPARLDHASRCESQTRAPAITAERLAPRWKANFRSLQMDDLRDG